MRNTGSSGRSKSSRDKGNTKVAQSQNHTTHTVKSEGLPVKPTIQATAEQVALNNLIQGKDTSDDEEQKSRITQIMEVTGCSQDKAVIALHDSKNDVNRAINQVFEDGPGEESEWRETGKKKKKQKTEVMSPPIENNIDMKPEKRDIKERNDRDNRDRNKDDKENDRSNREPSDYRRPRRNDNRPPRLSRGRGRPDRAGDRPEREEEYDTRDDNSRDRGFDRGRGRGRGGGFGSRRGRGGGSSSTGGSFRPSSSGFDKPSPFDNGPQIDTWTNETAVIGEKEPKISNWGDTKEDWNEDIDSWSGSLAETKVFTASANNPAPEPASTVPVQMESNTLSNTFDYGVLYPKHPQNDIGPDANYISQFNQQATESIKNSIGIGSGPSSSLHNSMTSQTASNVSALVSLTQNALQDNLVTELTGNGLTGSSLAGNGLVGTSLGSSLSTPVNSLTGNSLHSTSLSGELSGSTLTGTSLSGNSLSGNGNSLTGASVSVSSLPGSLAGSTLVPGTQTGSSAAGGGIHTSSVSQNAAMLQRAKPQRSKLPPPSKIPASAVEMPGHMMTTLDVQFGNLEFGSDSTPFSFGGNESVSNAFSSADSNSTPVINNHANAQVGQVSLSKTGDAMLSTGLEQSSPRNSTLYQQSPYTTPTKQNPADASNKINSPPEPIQMPGSTSDMKSTPLMTGQSPQVSLPSTKIDSSLGSYTSNSSYQSAGYQSQKANSGFPSSTKQGSYQGNQYQSSNNPTSSSQFSSQYRSSGQNQFPSGSSQFQSGSQYQSPPSGYQSNNTGYQSSQSSFQSNQSQFPSTGQNQYSSFQSGSTFPNQSSYSSNQSNQSSLYPSSTTSSYSSQSQQSSLYSQSSRQGSYSNQSYMNHDHGASAGSSNYQTSVTQSNSPFKDTQTGATSSSSYRDPSVSSSSKTRETPSDNSTYSRDTNSASSFSDSQSLAYNRDSQSVGNSYSRDPSSSYKRDSKSASASYPRESTTSESASFNRDSQSASASYSARDGQPSGYRESQSGAAGYGNQSGSYPSRDAANSQTQSGFNPKPYRNSTEVSTTLQTSLTGSKLADSFSKMGVNDGSLDARPSTNSQFDVSVTNSKLTTNSSSLTSSTTPASSSSSTTTVTSSTTTKISTLPTASSSSSSSKAPPNLPPGVPLMAQQYIMGQAGTLPFYGLQGLQGLAQQPMYANIGNLEDFQYLQQRMPPALATNNPMYDLSTAAAAGLQMPPTSLTSNSTQQTVPTVPYSGSTDTTGKLNRVEAQSPTGSVPTSTPSTPGQTAQHQQQPYIHLNYSYYYPPSLIPGAGFQYPMIPMPQVTNAAHAGTPANTQYQQKNQYGSHLQYATNKVAGVYDDLTAVQSGGDFSKSPYGNSQTQPKANVNTSVNAGSGSSDIQLPGGYGKAHAQQAFDKQGFHAGTPPPFSLQMAAGQLATGTQAGPLGAPGGPYGGPFVPLMTHQPHSQMMHHPLQDNSTSSRASQPTASHSQSKNSTKTYGGSNWGSY